MRLSLGHRYALYNFVLVVVLVGALSGVLLGTSQRTLSELEVTASAKAKDAIQSEAEGEIRSLARFISDAIANPLYQYKVGEVGSLIRAAASQSQIRHVMVLDAKGTVIHDSTDSLAAFGKQPKNQRIRNSLAAQDYTHWIEGEYIYATNPIRVGKTVIGYLNIGMSIKAAVESIRKIEMFIADARSHSFLNEIYLVLAISVFFMIVGVYVSNAVSRRLTRSIAELSDVAGAVAAGFLSARTKIERSDELGDLASSFNNMVSNLETEISERNRVERELRLAKDEAEEASRAKSQFLANMSHEIRTPMNGVLGMTDLLARTELNDRQRRFVETVRKSGETLLRVINDILDFSSIDANQFSLEEEDLDLHRAVEATIDLFAGSADAKEIGLDVAISDAVPSMVRADGSRLRQVLGNLINNAIKFTAEGAVTLRVSAENDGSQSLVSFTIEDTGIGIAEDARSHIFEPFRQADGSTSRRFGGTGLGLVIAKQIVESMGGDIRVDSEIGRGSVFTVKVPFDIVNSGTATSKSHADALAGCRILIVGADRAACKTIESRLASWNSTEVTSTTVDQLHTILSMLTISPELFDVIILDTSHEEIRSDDSLQEAISGSAQGGPPVVCIMPDEDTEAPFPWPEDNRVKVIPKPLRASILLDTLTELLDWTPLKGGHPGDAEGAQPRFSARILLAEDNPVNQEVALENLRLLGCTVDIAGDGAVAVEKWKSTSPDLIFMDCQMPDMDGFTATGHIRAQEAERGTGERVPIVALTAHALETDRQKCLAAGMDDHLSKPFKDAELIAVLENWLVPDTSPQAQGVQSGENTTMTNENEAPAGEDISDSAIDFAVFDQVCSLYNENAEGFERIIELFLNSAAESVEKIRDGVGQGDLETVQRVAHSLKSSSASMGATTLSDLCRALESQTAESVEDIADTMAQLDAEVGRVKTALTGFGPESADRAAV